MRYSPESINCLYGGGDMTSKLKTKIPVGYFHFHDDVGLNFQFNRALVNQCPMDEMMEAAQNIKRMRMSKMS